MAKDYKETYLSVFGIGTGLINETAQLIDAKRKKTEERLMAEYSKEINNHSLKELIDLYLKKGDLVYLEDVENILRKKEKLFGYDLTNDLEIILKEKLFEGFEGYAPESLEYFDKLNGLIKKLNIPIYLCNIERDWLKQNKNFPEFMSSLDKEEKKNKVPLNKQLCL